MKESSDEGGWVVSREKLLNAPYTKEGTARKQALEKLKSPQKKVRDRERETGRDRWREERGELFMKDMEKEEEERARDRAGNQKGDHGRGN